MIGVIFGILCLISFFVGTITGNAPALGNAVLDGAAGAVELTVSLCGIMCLWGGVMQVLSDVGAIGKLSRLMGRVTAIQYGFRIRLSAYQRVVAVVAPEVDGRLAMAGAYFAAFALAVLPRETIAAWLDMPDDADDVVCTGGDDTAYALDDLEAAEPSGAKGRQDTAEGRVLYLRLEGTQGYAIVRGEQLYEVTFVCDGKKGSGMTCSCYVYGACKHEYAVLCALRDLLAWAQRNHAGAWQKSGFFSAIQKETLFQYAISGRETGSIRLEA